MHVIMFKKKYWNCKIITGKVTYDKLEALSWSFIQNEKKIFQ